MASTYNDQFSIKFMKLSEGSYFGEQGLFG